MVAQESGHPRQVLLYLTVAAGQDVRMTCVFVCYSPAARIGRQLAMIGDDINDRYSPQFNQMIRTLNITPDTAYEAFAGVARK